MSVKNFASVAFLRNMLLSNSIYKKQKSESNFYSSIELPHKLESNLVLMYEFLSYKVCGVIKNTFFLELKYFVAGCAVYKSYYFYIRSRNMHVMDTFTMSHLGIHKSMKVRSFLRVDVYIL